METPNTSSLAGWWGRLGVDRPNLLRAFRTFNAGAKAFRAESEAQERAGAEDGEGE
jgi:hypothetical protein